MRRDCRAAFHQNIADASTRNGRFDWFSFIYFENLAVKDVLCSLEDRSSVRMKYWQLSSNLERLILLTIPNAYRCVATTPFPTETTMHILSRLIFLPYQHRPKQLERSFSFIAYFIPSSMSTLQSLTTLSNIVNGMLLHGFFPSYKLLHHQRTKRKWKILRIWEECMKDEVYLPVVRWQVQQ